MPYVMGENSNREYISIIPYKQPNPWLSQHEDNENHELRKDHEFNDNCLVACKVDSFPLKARAAQMAFLTATQ